MEQYFLKVKSVDKITHDVLKIAMEKPKARWDTERRPFTCIPGDNFFEFTIKTYSSHKSVTNELPKLKDDDELILHDVFGAIAYKGEGRVS